MRSYKKEGYHLSLTEAHSLLCKKMHDIAHAHDPCADVALTKCIFDHVIRKYRHDNLINDKNNN